MSIKHEAEKFLKSCRVIDNDEKVEGIIVTLNSNTDFKIIKVTCKEGEWNEEVIDEISIIDIIDKNDDNVIINFKEIMFEIIGENDKYMLEKCVYRFLIHDDNCFDYEQNNFYDEDAEECARREIAEEKEAEHNF